MLDTASPSAAFPPNWTPQTLKLDQLRQLTDLRQQVNNLARATGAQGLADGVLESGGPLAPANVLQQQQTQPQARPTAFPDGSLYQLKDLPDGQVEMQLITGEIFRGSPIDVTKKIAESNVHTKLWAREKVAQAQQHTAEPQLNLQPYQLPPSTGSLAGDLAAEQAENLARHFGFANEAEMVADYQSITQFRDRYADQMIAMEFMSRCPDFPQTEQANQALLGIADADGWNYTPATLQPAPLSCCAERSISATDSGANPDSERSRVPTSQPAHSPADVARGQPGDFRF